MKKIVLSALVLASCTMPSYQQGTFTFRTEQEGIQPITNPTAQAYNQFLTSVQRSGYDAKLHDKSITWLQASHCQNSCQPLATLMLEYYVQNIRLPKTLTSVFENYGKALDVLNATTPNVQLHYSKILSQATLEVINPLIPSYIELCKTGVHCHDAKLLKALQIHATTRLQDATRLEKIVKDQ